jgi:hypothetical protein
MQSPLDMSAQAMHLMEVMTAILQPLLWLLLVGGFVLASAHLLTMLGTRWGDRRVSPKALFFSLALHLSLGIAVVAMVPEYRQHVLSLGREDPPPVTVELVSPRLNAPQQSAPGDVPVWEQIPQQIQRNFERQSVNNVEPEEPVVTPPELPQLADMRPLEPVRIPEAPEFLPEQQLRPEESSRTTPAPQPAPLPAETPPTEARQDVQTPEQEFERSPARPEEMEPIERERPVVESPTAPPRLEERIASLSSTPSVEPLPELEPQRAPEPNATPAPVVPTLDAEPIEETPAAGNLAPTPPQLSRKRSPAFSRPREDAVERARPGLVAAPTTDAPPEPELPRPLRADPDLPDLYRPDADPAEAVASLDATRVPAAYRLRTEQERRDEAIRKYGGNEDSQKAVERALQWLASVQTPEGNWDASAFGAGNGPVETDPALVDRRFAGRTADTGLSALCILAMLGNGNTQIDGPYSVHVARGIEWLISQQKANGSLAGEAMVFEAIYCHGMAALALAEAYAMEQDAASRARLRAPLEKALAYSRSQQLSDGGWRYLARQLGGGDMSIFGWQVMAFRSAQDAGIPMSAEMRSSLIGFLRERGLGEHGGLAAYRPQEPVTPAMTAEALACKQMLGLKRDNPQAIEATDYLLRRRPRLSELNMYYWYYGTLAMFQHGGEPWEQWNASLRDLLVSEQVVTGPNAGSWEPKGPYAGYGGRLFSTAIATLCLEVYYRRLPMYQWAEE